MSDPSFAKVTSRFVRLLFDRLEDGGWNRASCELRLKHVIERAAVDSADAELLMIRLIEDDQETQSDGEG